MNYELVLQLKEAGFPFEIEENLGILTTEQIATMWKDKFVKFGIDWFYMPTLSELIEACGDGFISLDRFGIANLGIEFVCNKDRPWRSQGKTAEEAVANLWLLLNKKINDSRYRFPKENRIT